MNPFPMGQYLPGDSLLHRLDPRMKILCTILLSIFTLRMEGRGVFLLGGFLGALFLLSRIPLSSWLKSLKPMMVLLALILLVHLFLAGGVSPGERFPFPGVSARGFYRGVLICGQFMLLILSASLLTMTTSPSEFIVGMERLLRPLRVLRVPSHDLAMMVSLALRFLPVFLGEFERMKTAHMARCSDFRSGNPLRRLRRLYSFALPILFHTSLRADELADALAGRGYRRGPRTYLRELHLTGLDYRAAALAAGFFLLLHLL